jgi:hypothetical protein
MQLAGPGDIPGSPVTRDRGHYPENPETNGIR